MVIITILLHVCLSIPLSLSRSVNEKIDTYAYVFLFTEIVAYLYCVKRYHSPVEIYVWKWLVEWGFQGTLSLPKRPKLIRKLYLLVGFFSINGCFFNRRKVPSGFLYITEIKFEIAC